MSTRRKQNLKAHMKRKKKRRLQRRIIVSVSGVLLFLLISFLYLNYNKPELIVIRPRNVEINQGEALPKLSANITYAGKRKKRALGENGYTLSSLLSDLKKGKHYELVFEGDTNVDNKYPIHVKFTEDFKNLLKNQYQGKIELKTEKGHVTVLNSRGKWQSDDKGKRFLLEDGTYLANQYLNSQGQLYYFDSNGYMVTGDVPIGRNIMHFNKKGAFEKRGELLPLDPARPMIALTFDDGPGSETAGILDTLEKYNAHATFFMLGTQIPNHPDIPGRMLEIGCELGNHSYGHPNLTKESPESIRTQFNQTNQLLTDVAGSPATVARVPYGAINGKVSANMTLPAIFWTIDTRDWETKNKDANVAATLQGAGDGHIILLHDIHKSTAESVEPIILGLYAQGYQLVTINEMAKAKNITLEPGKSYHIIQ
ncbi:peptidoglycan/xylan/chitin deacetylase (PgdA/CDA1 family) [Lachnospiraceae bacterium PM6-15]|uniref:polysaccharide deacetylase family protein n=1 Tax=Ohessyouella blattaphilus TaxID=2949333 RepID=UPI003E1996C6